MRSIRIALVATAMSAFLSLTADIAAARLATARYATSLAAAKAAGYQIITRMIPPARIRSCATWWRRPYNCCRAPVWSCTGTGA